MITLSKAKLELLKRKSRRNNLIKDLPFLNPTVERFLDMEENDIFCRKTVSLLQARINKIQVQGDHYKETIQKSVALLKKISENTAGTSQKGRLLFFRENEIEAVLISVEEVFSNLDKVLELTKFLEGHGDFIFVAEDFSFGLCIERTEYFYEFSAWGLT